MGERDGAMQLSDTVLAELVNQLFGPLALYAVQFCDCPEDAVQETFLELQRRPLAEFKPLADASGCDVEAKPLADASGCDVEAREAASKPLADASGCDGQLRPDMVHLRAWLFRTVRHRALNWQRSDQRRRRNETTYVQARTWFVAPGDSKCEADEAVAALQSLAEDLRETVIARLWGNLTLEEIAELTEVSISTAQRRYIRGLEQMRQRLEQSERPPHAVPRRQS